MFNWWRNLKQRLKEASKITDYEAAAGWLNIIRSNVTKTLDKGVAGYEIPIPIQLPEADHDKFKEKVLADYKDLAEQKGYTVVAEPRADDWIIIFTRINQLLGVQGKLHSDLSQLIAQNIPHIDIKWVKEDILFQEELRSTIFLMAQEQGYRISEDTDETYWHAQLEKVQIEEA